MSAALWTVHSRVDCYHEPEFPGDLAEFVTIWRAERNHVQLRPGNFTCDDCEEFDTEAEARAYCDRMNAAAGMHACAHDWSNVDSDGSVWPVADSICRKCGQRKGDPGVSVDGGSDGR